MMKLLSRYIPAAVLACMSLACSREDGLVPDSDACYDVYFAGGQSRDYEVDESGEASLTFTVKRTNIRGAITVPVKIETGERGIFALSTLRFADGEGTATMSVLFDEAKVQQKYSARISIEDPLYAKIYGRGDTSVEFSVVREDYRRCASGVFYSPMLQSSYSIWEQDLEYSETLDTYRFASLFEDGYHVCFKWDGGLNVVLTEESYDTGMTYNDESGNSLGHITGDAVSAAYDPSVDVFSFTYDYVVEGYGGFGELTDQYMVSRWYQNVF